MYVDDLTLSGPEAQHDAFWKKLSARVDLEPPTALERVLGRYHDNVEIPAALVRGNFQTAKELAIRGTDSEQENRDPKESLGSRPAAPKMPAVSFNMGDYAAQCVELYESLTGAKKLKPAPTPFVNEGSLCPEDDDVQGELAGSACKALMKCLWLGRLARPDIIKPIGDLATHIQSWSRNCDRQLHRLVCYLKASTDYRLIGCVNDAPESLKLRLFIDADFAGCRETAKSTTGGYLVLVGENTYFPYPGSRRSRPA